MHFGFGKLSAFYFPHRHCSLNQSNQVIVHHVANARLGVVKVQKDIFWDLLQCNLELMYDGSASIQVIDQNPSRFLSEMQIIFGSEAKPYHFWN